LAPLRQVGRWLVQGLTRPLEEPFYIQLYCFNDPLSMTLVS